MPLRLPKYRALKKYRDPTMLCDHCGDVYELLADVRVLNQLSNLFGGKWAVWVCAGCGHVQWFRP